MKANGGFEVAFSGEYREVDRPHRLVRTEVFELFPDAEALSTITFEESHGVTTLRILGWYPTKDIRDAAVASGMEGGLQTSLDALEGLDSERGVAQLPRGTASMILQRPSYCVPVPVGSTSGDLQSAPMPGPTVSNPADRSWP